MKATVWANVLEEGQENTISDQKRPESDQKDSETYFPSAILRYVVKQPLQLLEAEGKYDIKANLDGACIIRYIGRLFARF